MPQIPEINPSMANTQSIGRVSIDNPLVRDERYAAKAQKYQKISNILEIEGREYKQKWERKQAVQRQMTSAQEQMNADVLGDKLLQDARNLPDDEVLPFIQKGMEQYNAQAYKRYGGDQEMWGQVSLNLQKSALETQHKAFNFIQERAKDTALAAFAEQEMYLKSKALNSKDPNIELQKLDASLDSLVKAGYISKTQAAKTSIDSRGDVTVGRISQMISRNNLSAAAQTLEANRAMLPLNAQIQLENNIKSTAEALQNRAEAARNKQAILEAKIQELEYTDPAGAAVLKGIPADDTKAIYIATNRRSVMNSQEGKKYKARLEAAQTSTEFVNTYNEIFQQKVGKYDDGDPIKIEMAEKFEEEMRDSVSPTSYTMMQLSRSGAEEQLKQLFAARKMKEEQINAVISKKDIIPTIEAKSTLYTKWLSLNRTPDEVADYKETIARIAGARMLTSQSSAGEAVAFATTGTADLFGSFRLYGSEVIVPKSVPEKHVKKGLEMYVKESFGLDNSKVAFVLDKNANGYFLFDPSDNTRLVNDKDPLRRPYYIGVGDAVRKSRDAEQLARRKMLNTKIRAVGKAISAPEEKNKKEQRITD